MNNVPKSGFNGLIQNWQSDLLAAFSVSLVALPLGLGIAVASGMPPISGVFSAIIGGIVCTFVKGSHLTINGPTAGLITVILTSIAILDDGSGQALNYVVAAIFVSGFLQVILGLLRLGRYADIFHSTVIKGVLAAIGVIIIAKQIHLALGTTPSSTHIVQSLIDAVKELPNLNPFVFSISLLGLLLLIFHSRINFKLFHLIPAPMWVLMVSIPLVYLFNFFEYQSIHFFGKTYNIGPDLLINIPDNVLDALIFPNFEKINTWAFWSSVISITVIASIESLACNKAVDKLDPYKRKTKLNKDLVGIGLGTMVCGAVGALPVISAIVRSSVNIHNNAKTKWSNFYHSILLVVFVFLLTPAIQKVPLAALAILLVYTGVKLASPKVFKQVYMQGSEQLIFFVGTLLITIFSNLLLGIAGGLLLVLIVHYIFAKLPLTLFFKNIYKSGTELSNKGLNYTLNFKGIANFLTSTKLSKQLNLIPAKANVTFNFENTRLVDFSILEHVYEFIDTHNSYGGVAEIVGLENHRSSSPNKLALKVNRKFERVYTPRQLATMEWAKERGLQFTLFSDKNLLKFKSFYFFKTRQIQGKFNCVEFLKNKSSFHIMDVLFTEGALIAQNEYKTTLGMIDLPFAIPKFTIERKSYLDNYLHLQSHKDIDYTLYSNFPNNYVVKVENKDKMDGFITDAFKEFFKDITIDHIESNGESILIFNNTIRLAKVREFEPLVELMQSLVSHIKVS